ncbi:MAG: S-adenosylmethionine:tRNA ribosyltransferase-isomerase, partial [Rubrobacter sp.]|nr:S-adenosylmethionine:tRNA ribosyltransferase-isomerase [Rubrobacter sp.]
MKQSLPTSRNPEILPSLDFELPSELEAGEPPEARGLSRDEVRLMVSHAEDDRILHSRFYELGEFLDPGDVLAINTSATMKAALPARRENGDRLALHLSTHLPGDLWVVEARTAGDRASQPFYEIVSGETLRLPQGASAILHAPYSRDRNFSPQKGHNRLWLAALENTQLPLGEYLEEYGSPIRYGYVGEEWPISYYRTVYATGAGTDSGSAEMPSAGRAFTPELITSLAARGIQIAPLVLHTGVSSPEEGEPPYEEFYRVPQETARLVNSAHEHGKRVVAVGTTAVRALESAADEEGTVHPARGWTDLVVTPHRGLRAVSAM